MDKIITRIPKLKGRNLRAYNYEITKSSSSDDIAVPYDFCDDKSNGLDSSNAPEEMILSDESSCLNAKQEMSNQEDTINITKALLIENYAEVLVQKLRLLNSDKAKLHYYYPSGI